MSSKLYTSTPIIMFKMLTCWYIIYQPFWHSNCVCPWSSMNCKSTHLNVTLITSDCTPTTNWVWVIDSLEFICICLLWAFDEKYHMTFSQLHPSNIAFRHYPILIYTCWSPVVPSLDYADRRQDALNANRQLLVLF